MRLSLRVYPPIFYYSVEEGTAMQVLPEMLRLLTAGCATSEFEKSVRQLLAGAVVVGSTLNLTSLLYKMIVSISRGE